MEIDIEFNWTAILITITLFISVIAGATLIFNDIRTDKEPKPEPCQYVITSIHTGHEQLKPIYPNSDGTCPTIIQQEAKE